MSESILKAREERYETIKKLSKTYQYLIVLKANTPGNDKNRYSSFFLIQKINILISKQFDINYKTLNKGFDGPYYVYSISCDNPMTIKKELIEIETTHPLGRLIDLDFYVNSKMISRADYNLELRCCMICNHSAIDCMRNNRHTLNDILNHIDKVILNYLKVKIDSIIRESMLSELNLEYKFGLVTPTSNGSHDDMNYEMMRKSIDVLIPYFLEILEIGFLSKSNKNLFEEAQLIGIKAEQAMLQHSNQVNTYKGLIYILGFVLLSIGDLIKYNLSINDIFQIITNLSTGVLNDFNTEMNTAGINAFKSYQLTGIRGEIHDGLPTIKKAFTSLQKIDFFDTKNYHQILLFFMENSQDTVLLKRCKTLDNYHQIKSKIAKINPKNIKELKSFTDYCVQKNISFGGSADLFIIFQVLKRIDLLIS